MPTGDPFQVFKTNINGEKNLERLQDHILIKLMFAIKGYVDGNILFMKQMFMKISFFFLQKQCDQINEAIFQQLYKCPEYIKTS